MIEVGVAWVSVLPFIYIYYCCIYSGKTRERLCNFVLGRGGDDVCSQERTLFQIHSHLLTYMLFFSHIHNIL